MKYRYIVAGVVTGFLLSFWLTRVPSVKHATQEPKATVAITPVTIPSVAPVASAPLPASKSNYESKFHSRNYIERIWESPVSINMTPSEGNQAIQFSLKGSHEKTYGINWKVPQLPGVRIMPGVYYRLINSNEQIVFDAICPVIVMTSTDVHDGKLDCQQSMSDMPFRMDLPATTNGSRVEGYWVTGTEKYLSEVTVAKNRVLIASIKG